MEVTRSRQPSIASRAPLPLPPSQSTTALSSGHGKASGELLGRVLAEGLNPFILPNELCIFVGSANHLQELPQSTAHFGGPL